MSTSTTQTVLPKFGHCQIPTARLIHVWYSQWHFRIDVRVMQQVCHERQNLKVILWYKVHNSTLSTMGEFGPPAPMWKGSQEVPEKTHTSTGWEASTVWDFHKFIVAIVLGVLPSYEMFLIADILIVVGVLRYGGYVHDKAYKSFCLLAEEV